MQGETRKLPRNLTDLFGDVYITEPADGQYLRYSTSTGRWGNYTLDLSGKSDVGHTHTPSQVGLSNVANVNQQNASNLTSGTVPNARLGTSGTRDSSTFYRGDGVFSNNLVGQLTQILTAGTASPIRIATRPIVNDTSTQVIERWGFSQVGGVAFGSVAQWEFDRSATGVDALAGRLNLRMYSDRGSGTYTLQSTPIQVQENGRVFFGSAIRSLAVDVTPYTVANGSGGSRATVLAMRRPFTTGIKFATNANFNIHTYDTTTASAKTLVTLSLSDGNTSDGVTDADVMSWRGDGRVGIGTTTPNSPLHVVGLAGSFGQLNIDSTATSQQSNFSISKGGTRYWVVYTPGADDTFRWFGSIANADAFTVTQTGLITVVGTAGGFGMRDRNSPRTAVWQWYMAGTVRMWNGSADIFEIGSDFVRVATARTPASATATGTAGMITWDANYLYICTAANTWRRIAHATW